MSELGMTPKPDGVIAKTSRRVAVALTMSVGVDLLMMYGWTGSPSALFLRTSILGLSATAAARAWAPGGGASRAQLPSLQARVPPFFLFNPLANGRALADAGSPHASAPPRSLPAYLRAVVPLLHDPAATIERELQLVRP